MKIKLVMHLKTVVMVTWIIRILSSPFFILERKQNICLLVFRIINNTNLSQFDSKVLYQMRYLL